MTVGANSLLVALVTAPFTLLRRLDRVRGKYSKCIRYTFLRRFLRCQVTSSKNSAFTETLVWHNNKNALERYCLPRCVIAEA